MTLQKLELSSLAVIDGGKLAAAWDLAMERVRHDCDERATTAEPRRVTLTMLVRPVADDRGNLETCEIAFDVADSVPKKKTKTYAMKAAPGGLFWNELSPSDFRQGTLDLADPKPRKAESDVG